MNWVVVFTIIVFKFVITSYHYDEELWEIEVYGRKEKLWKSQNWEKDLIYLVCEYKNTSILIRG